MCNCDVDKGQINEECSCDDARSVKEISQYVASFIDNRFPSGVSDDYRKALSEIVLDAFYDGARWQEQAAREESGIVLV